MAVSREVIHMYHVHIIRQWTNTANQRLEKILLKECYSGDEVRAAGVEM